MLTTHHQVRKVNRTGSMAHFENHSQNYGNIVNFGVVKLCVFFSFLCSLYCFPHPHPVLFIELKNKRKLKKLDFFLKV